MREPLAVEPVRRRAVLLYVAACAVFLMICAAWDRLLLRGGYDFWDARVYAKALGVWRAGGDPYLFREDGLPFVYAPVFLPAMSALGRVLPGAAGWVGYGLALIAATLATPWLLAREYVRARWLTPLLAQVLFVFQPKLLGEIVLLSGNLSTLLYGAALVTGVAGLRRNSWLAFYCVVALASVVKPPFLMLLLLPLLAGARQQWRVLVCFAVTALVYGGQRLLMEPMYWAFQNAVVQQVVVREDAGFGVFAHLLRLGHRVHIVNPLAATLGHMAVTGVLLVGVMSLRRVRREAGVAELWVPLLLVVAVVANPRMQVYDAEIAMIPATVLWVEAALAARLRRSAPLWIGVPAAGLTALLSRNAEDAVLLWLLGAAAVTLWRIRGIAKNRPGGFTDGVEEIVAQRELA